MAKKQNPRDKSEKSTAQEKDATNHFKGGEEPQHIKDSKASKQKIEFEKTDPTPEEKDFIDQYNKMAEDEKKKGGSLPQGGQPDMSGQQAKTPPDIEYGQLAGLIADTFNEIGAERGYDPVSEAQRAFLVKHSAAVEEKYLKDIMIYPEVEAGLAHLVVYLPKWTKHMKAAGKTQKKT